MNLTNKTIVITGGGQGLGRSPPPPAEADAHARVCAGTRVWNWVTHMWLDVSLTCVHPSPRSVR